MNYIGIPTVNLARYLQQTIASIKTKYEFKVFIVDNGSNDGETKEWIENSGHEFIRNEQNLGVSRAWNQIIQWAISYDDCNSIFILNNDIVLHEDAMDYLIEDLTVGQKDAISGVNIGNKPQMLVAFQLPIQRWSSAMNFSCFGLTPKTVKRIGFFDENFQIGYFEDNDYHHRMLLEGLDCACDMYAQFIHYGSRTIKEGGVANEPYFSQNKEYFRQKWGYYPWETRIEEQIKKNE